MLIYNDGLTSSTLIQQLKGRAGGLSLKRFLSNVVHLSNVGSMLGQRRSRGLTLKQHWINVSFK